jgi:hypothetical protein
MAAAGTSWLSRYRAALYPILNMSVLLAALAGSIARGVEPGLVIYVCALFAICSVPVLLLRHLSDRYALLAIFMAVYFLLFGALDLSVLVVGTDVPVVRTAFLSPAELAILTGAALVLLGYLGGVQLGRGTASARPPKEWPAGTMLILGLLLWIVGTAASLYFQVFSAPEKTDRAAHSAFANMGPLLTFAVMLGNMLQPLGILILAYGYATRRGALWLALIVTVVMIEVALGFVTDVKRTALMGAALVIMTRALVDNRLPKAWIASSVVAIALAFPLFQAYRTEISGERGLDRAHAFRELDKVLEIVLASRDKAPREEPGERSQTFLERSSVKGAVETVFSHAGVDVPFLAGRSLVALPMAFVPRLLVPDKVDVSAGQLFTRAIAKADTDTYISISHLGELYWNFGWLGVLAGLPLSGLLLGFVGAKFNLEQGSSVTRVLVLLVTAQSLCIGFEGTVPIAYTIWLRSMAAIGLLHLVLARASIGVRAAVGDIMPPEQRPALRSMDALVPAPLPAARFPNMMR